MSRTTAFVFLTAIVAVVTLAAAGLASATAVCEDEAVSGACGLPYEKGTVFAGKASNTIFTSSLGTIACTEAAAEGKTSENATAEKTALKGQLTAWTFSSCKMGATACTVKAGGLPYATSTNWTEKSNGTVKVEKNTEAPSAQVVCGAFVSCTYSAEPILDLNGGEAGKATIVANSEPLKAIGGLFCPGEATWSATYTLSAPKGGKQFVAAKALPPTVFCKSATNPCGAGETYGKAAIEAKLVNPPGATFEWEGAVQNTCTTSTLKGTTVTLGEPSFGTITELSFGGCTCPTSAKLLPWLSKLRAFPPPNAGDGAYTFTTGGGGNPTFEITNCHGKSCNFSLASFTTAFVGGNPAKILMSPENFPEQSGGCGQMTLSTGKYNVETPKPVWIETQ